jgi:hypothetical protein
MEPTTGIEPVNLFLTKEALYLLSYVGMHFGFYLVSIHKWSFCPISALCSKNNPRNINYMPAVIFFACLDLEQKSSFMDGHYLIYLSTPLIFNVERETRLELATSSLEG